LNRKDAVKIEAPFVNYSKADVLREGVGLGVDYAQTWSCYAGQDKACGQCPTCAERLKAFEEVGLVDPIAYRS
jgi:7-cyano-7-deazaguanine synthase